MISLESSNVGQESQQRNEVGANKTGTIAGNPEKCGDNEIKPKTPHDPDINVAHDMEDKRTAETKRNRLSLKRKVTSQESSFEDKPRKKSKRENEKKQGHIHNNQKR